MVYTHRRRPILAVAILAVAAHAVAGEEHMPLAGPGSMIYEIDPMESGAPMQRISSGEPTQARPRLQKNVVKLAIPAPLPDGEPRLRLVEAKTNESDGTLTFDLTNAPVADLPAFEPEPPAARPTVVVLPDPIIPDSGPESFSQLMTLVDAASREPVTESFASPMAVADKSLKRESFAMSAPAASRKRRAMEPMPTLESLPSFSPLPDEPPPAAGFSPIDNIDIPGLATPDLFVKDRKSLPTHPVRATTYSAKHDELLDLIPSEYAAKLETHKSAAPLPDVSPSLPAMPVLADSGVTTLEPLALAPSRSLPRPEQIQLPPPLAPIGMGAGIPEPLAEAPIALAASPLADGEVLLFSMPASPPLEPQFTGEKIITNHVDLPSYAPVLEPVPAKPAEQPVVDTLSLRPPPNFAPPESPKPSPASAQFATPPMPMSPLMFVPQGLSLTATPGSMRPQAGSGTMQGPGMTEPHLFDAASAESHDTSSYSRATAAHRRRLAINERTVPEVPPGNPDGLTTMRNMKNLLGSSAWDE